MTHAKTLSPDTLAYLAKVTELPTVAVLAVEFAACVSKWTTRRRTRKALQQLSHWQLEDVGLTPTEATREASKVFWQP
ncbi:MAG: DUF1127 domain-containing protein [Pseudomonadota bacterium]